MYFGLNVVSLSVQSNFIAFSVKSDRILKEKIHEEFLKDLKRHCECLICMV